MKEIKFKLCDLNDIDQTIRRTCTISPGSRTLSDLCFMRQGLRWGQGIFINSTAFVNALQNADDKLLRLLLTRVGQEKIIKLLTTEEPKITEEPAMTKGEYDKLKEDEKSIPEMPEPIAETEVTIDELKIRAKELDIRGIHLFKTKKTLLKKIEEAEGKE